MSRALKLLAMLGVSVSLLAPTAGVAATSPPMKTGTMAGKSMAHKGHRGHRGHKGHKGHRAMRHRGHMAKGHRGHKARMAKGHKGHKAPMTKKS